MIKKLVRYLRLIYKITAYSFMGSLEYRFQTIMRIVRVFFENLLMIFFVLSVFQKSSTVAGWSKDSVLLTFAIFNIIWATMYFFISDNLLSLGRVIKKGDLDGLLLRPIDNQFIISCHEMHAQNLIRIFVGLALGIFAANSIGLSLNFAQVLLFIISMLSSLVIGYSFMLLVATLSFWTFSNETYELANTGMGISRYPLSIFPRHVVTALTVIPIIFISTVPTQILLGKIDFLAAVSPAVAITLFVLSRKFLFFALKRYSSASS